jgi:nucleoside 2-deoxyribosyltransferase
MSYSAFVSMPFGKDPDLPSNPWTRLFLHGLKPLELFDPEDQHYIPVELSRADKRLQDLVLKESVRRLIEGCTFVIAVLTADNIESRRDAQAAVNPNVLWELGYAEAWGKPVIAIADHGQDLSKLPVLTGQPSVFRYDHAIIDRCRTETDAAAALSPIAKGLRSYVKVACEEARKRPTSPKAYASRTEIDLPALVRSAQYCVDILSTNVSYFLSREFQGEIASEHPIASALRQGATVRVVTLDPESSIAEYRARQLDRGHDVWGYRQELRNAIIEMHAAFGGYSDFSLHLYNDLPLQITIRVDETIITSVVTRGDRSRKRIQFQLHLTHRGVSESFVSHFQSMYDTSLDVRRFDWVMPHPKKRHETE